MRQPTRPDSLRNADPSVNPEDLRHPLVADHLRGGLPASLVEVNGSPRPAPADVPQPSEVLSADQMARRVTDRLHDGLTKNPDDLLDATWDAIILIFLAYNVDLEAVRASLPYNAAQVRAGGFALLNASTGVEEAKALKVDAPALGKDLAQGERIRKLRAIFDPAFQILEANETQVLGRLATKVDGALERGWSLIQSNGALQRVLAPALAIRGKPAQEAQETKAHNERVEKEARADEQAKAAAAGGGQPAGATTTITTQVPAQPAGGVPKTPAGPGKAGTK